MTVTHRYTSLTGVASSAEATQLLRKAESRAETAESALAVLSKRTKQLEDNLHERESEVKVLIQQQQQQKQQQQQQQQPEQRASASDRTSASGTSGRGASSSQGTTPGPRGTSPSRAQAQGTASGLTVDLLLPLLTAHY